MYEKAATEEAWFRHWTPEVEALLEPYAHVWLDTGLRPTEIQERVEYALCARILGHARRHHAQAWEEAPTLLRSARRLGEVLGLLFGGDTPASVAAMALEAVVQQSEEHDEQQSVLIGRQARKRDAERQQLGLPRYVWVVRIMARDKMRLAVESRDKLADKSVGLVRVVDARQGEKVEREG